MPTQFLPDAKAFEELQRRLEAETGRADVATESALVAEYGLIERRAEIAELVARVERLAGEAGAVAGQLREARERIAELEATVGPIAPGTVLQGVPPELVHETAWRVEKAAVCTGNGTRVIGVCNKSGRPDPSMAFELARIHNRQVLQLLDEAAAIGPLRDELADLKVRISTSDETRTAAQAEATRQTNARRDFSHEVRKALRLGAGGDVLGAIYRLQRLADAARNVMQHEARL